MLALLAALLLAAAPPAGTPNVPIEPAPFGLFDATDPSNTIGASFTRDGNTVYFMKSEPGGVGLTIFVAHRDGAGWSSPEVAPFSGIYPDADPSVTPAGDAVVFSSARPPLPGKFALYEVFLSGPQAGRVVALPNSANALGDQYYGSVAPDGTLYFTLSTDTGYALYSVPAIAQTPSQAQPVAIPGDAKGVSDFDETIASSGSYMIFASDRQGSGSASDLYVSFRGAQGKWCLPVRLPPPVNQTAADMATGLSADGRTLYFASQRTAVTMPRERPATAGDFKAMLAEYSNNTLHSYRADIGAWLDAVKLSSGC